MFIRHLVSGTLVTGLFLASGALALADKSHDGKVVAVTEGTSFKDGKLVMTDKEGQNEHSHMIASSAKITRNGKTAKLNELKKGDAVTVTTTDDGKVTALAAKEATASGATETTSPDSTKSTTASNRSGANDQSTPDILKNHKLSSEQQTKIDEIVKKYDDECQATWTQFTDRYQKAIRMEAAMLAAIEEHFTDAQRKQVREQRRRTAHHKHHDGKTAVKVSPPNNVEEELVVIGIRLTPEQQDKAQHVRHSFVQRLTSVNEDIERLHAKMISLETEKLLDIEDVLTQEQREQLRKDHESVTSQPESTSDTTTR